MTTRQFDPVFSAALRNELEALADATVTHETAQHPGPRRSQVWIAVVTAVVLILATVGVLRLASTPVPPADPSPARVVDPLSRITDPASLFYVARSVNTLLDVRGAGSGARMFDVPPGVNAMQVYLNCSGSAKYSVAIDHEGGGDSSGCDPDSGTNFGIRVRPGRHEVQVTVARGTVYALTIIAMPAPTIAAGPLIDPLTQVQDRRDPDAVPGVTRALLQERGSRGGAAQTTFAVPSGTNRLRVFLACVPSSASTEVHIDGHVVTGCMNAIAHWFDFTPSTGAVTAGVVAPGTGGWSLLVIPAPRGSKDSPANTVLPYPKAGGSRIAAARGSGAAATGTYVLRGSSVLVTTTCRGTGWLEIATGDGGTNTRGSSCSSTPSTVGFGGARDAAEWKKPLRWRVIPHGDISWTFQLARD